MKGVILISMLVCAAMAGQCVEDCQAECKSQGMTNSVAILQVCEFKCSEQAKASAPSDSVAERLPTDDKIRVKARLGSESPYDQCVNECTADCKSKGMVDDSLIWYKCQGKCDQYKDSSNIRYNMVTKPDAGSKSFYNLNINKQILPIARVIRKTELLGFKVPTKMVHTGKINPAILKKLGKNLIRSIIPKRILGKGFFKRIIPKRILGKLKISKAEANKIVKIVHKDLPNVLGKGFFKRIIPKRILGKVNFRAVIPKKLVSYDVPSIERPTVLLASSMDTIINKAKDFRKKAVNTTDATKRKVKKFMKAITNALEKYLD